jgi:hypothetical protein
MTVKMLAAGIVALGGVALSSGTACAAMPLGLSSAVKPALASNVDHVRWVCGPFRCWWRPNYYGAYGFYDGPRFYGRGWRGGWHRGWRRW